MLHVIINIKERYLMEIDCHTEEEKSERLRNATIYDIAARAGVSPSTVSRVLGRSAHPVSPDVRDNVLKAAQELNYIPNAQARFLKTQNNLSLGIIIPSIDNPFYPQMIRGMSDVAVSRNYSVYLSNCDREYSVTDQQIQRMLEMNVRGIISVYIEKTTPSLKNFVERGGILVSLCGKNYSYDGAYNLRTDKVEESEIALEHLIGLGHRKIALLMNEINCQIRKDKLAGYKRALKNNGIEFRPEYLFIGGEASLPTGEARGISDADRGKEYVRELLKKCPEVTAILCMNDMMALGVCAELRNNHLSVPGDYSVMGFDDSFFSAFSNPALTTVALDKYEWGRILMSFLIEKIENGESSSGKTQLLDNRLPPVHLVARESTGAPRNI